MVRILLLLAALISLSGCLEDQGKSSAMVIPPGSHITLDMTKANKAAEYKYSLYLAEFLQDEQKTRNLMDLTSDDKPNLLDRILPKGLTISNSAIAKVVMSYRSTPWHAVVFPDTLIPVNLDSTLVYNLLASYSGRPMASYTASEVQEITDAVKSFREERMAVFGIAETYNPDLLYRFVRNGLSGDYKFLTLLKKYNIQFDFDADGNILKAPYPFNVQNHLPVLDEKATTKQDDQTVKETESIQIRATASDPDGDQIFYIWTFDGKPMTAEEGLAKWTTDYTHGRAAPYEIAVLFSDGGPLQKVAWDIYVINVNRRPEYIQGCTLKAVENQEWVCKVKYTDPDGEPVVARMQTMDGSGPLTLNGQAAPGDLSGAQEAEIRWRPNNADALKKSGYVVMELEDPLGGITYVSWNIVVEDKNEAPYVVGGSSGANIIYNNPFEYDYCANEVPDGVEPFRFSFDIVDPDNIGTPAADPPDEIDYTITGTLSTYMTKVSEVAIAGGLRVTYDWKPLHSVKTGTFIVTAKDNHGGYANAVTMNFTAQDRNTKPCLATGDVSSTLNYTSVGTNSSLTTSDKDGDASWMELFGFGTNSSWGMLKYIQDCSTNLPIYLKRNIGQSEPTYRKNSTTLCVKTRYSSDWWTSGGGAGYVIFTRSNALTGRPTASITIKKGTVLTSTVAGAIQKFQTYYDVVVLPEDYIVYIPVQAVSTAVPIGKLTNSTATGFTVTNAAAIDLKGSVTFTRTTATTAATIAAGTTLTTAESATGTFVNSVTFEVPDKVVVPIGTYSVTVPVWRLFSNIPTTSNLTISDTTLTVSTDPFKFTAVPSAMLANYNAVPYNPEPNFASTAVKFNYRAIDGNKPAANEVKYFVDALPTGLETLSVTNPAACSIECQVTFTRTNTTSAVTIPAGTKVMTAIRTQYVTLGAVTMAAGVASVSGVWLERTNHVGYPASKTYTATYTHLNVASKLVTSPILQAYEGTDLTAGPIEVADSASALPSPLYTLTDYWYPYDRRDSFSFVVASSGTAPTGTWKTCREPGTAYTDACTSCGPYSSSNFLAASPSSGWGYFNTNKCYFRYKPVAADLSGTFAFKLTVYEVVNNTGAKTPSAYTPVLPYNSWTASLSLIVNEVNRPSIMTDSTFGSTSYSATGLGSTYTKPVVLGDYQEGIAGFYNIYTIDTNKGTDLKTTNFELDSQVYDLKTGVWRARPAGLSVTIDKMENLTTTAGSKTTARISWTPTDAESKSFSGSSGFVIKMKIYDSKSTPTLSQVVYGYYKVRLINQNQIPSISSLGTNNQITVYADTYVKKEFYIYDNDAYIPEGKSFSTLLTICRDSNGNALQHATLDNGNTDPYNCHATSKTFPEELTTYDSAYDHNTTVSPCYIGGALNTDLAVPKFTQSGVAEVVSGVLRQKYQMEWCPQRGQIGVYTAELDANDNGDMDRDGLLLARAISSSPLQISVVAPVFLVSPRLNINNVPIHYMPQTAASMNDYPFRYETIVNNSIGNKLQYSLLKSPRACGVTNGMCIDSATGVITWVPSYLTDITATGGQGSLVQVQVKDTITGDIDSAYFYLNVQSATSPFEQPPVINSYIPASDSVQVAEKSPLTFSVSASDPNSNDILFYRWYVNDVLKSDEGATFIYKPADTDGSYDPDGSGSRKAGEFIVRVEVTDGNYKVSRSWNVKVRNTYLIGDSIFDFATARAESTPTITMKSLSWIGEIPYGVTVGNDYQDHLIIAGSYLASSTTKYFLWDLLAINGAVSKPNGSLKNPPWNFTQDLPWLTGTTTRRMAINPLSSTGYDVIMTSQTARSGPFGLTTEALHIINGDLTSLALSGSNKCSGDCSTNLYTSNYYTDSRITTSMDSAYVFYASDAGNVLLYDYLSPSSPSTIYSFGTAKITGMTLNRAIDRLYVTTQQTSPSISHKIYVFNVAPARSGTIPTLVTSLNVFDGVTGHEDCKPSDIVYDSVTNRVYALLSGTGGVVTFPDSASTTPTTSTMQFIGVSELNSSSFDVPGGGKRLVVRATDRLLIGTMEGANQVFTIDLTDYRVYVSAVASPIASIASYDSGQIFLVSRSAGKVYRAK